MRVRTFGLGLALLVCGCDTIDSVTQVFTGSSAPPPAAAAAPVPAPAQAATPVRPPAPAAPPPAPLAVANTGAFASGFDCNDGNWCLSVSPNGDVSIGNPNGGDAKMRLAARNVLAGQPNRQPRSFVVKCVPADLLPQDSHICRAIDSYGNIYGGSVRNPAAPSFFKRLTEWADPSAPGVAQLVPGFDCNDATWCLGVAPNGDVYLGNANGYEGGMRPTGKNVLAGQANRQPRSFTIRCVASGTLEDAFVCRGSDSLGNVYAGNSRSPANPNFFKLR